MNFIKLMNPTPKLIKRAKKIQVKINKKQFICDKCLHGIYNKANEQKKKNEKSVKNTDD